MFDHNDLDVQTAAYHEAGHVLMAHLLGGEVVHVTLESEDDELAGQTRVHWRITDEEERQRCSALVAIAGPLAESRWRGEAPALEGLTAWHADWREVEQVLQAQPAGTDHAQLLQQWLLEVRAQFEDPLVWEMLCRVADALEAHETLDEDLLGDVLG